MAGTPERPGHHVFGQAPARTSRGGCGYCAPPAARRCAPIAHDFRVMRADRGYWCLPEADINIPFTPGMAALIQSRLTPQTAHEAMLTARRYGGSDAAAAGIVDQVAGEDAVHSTAIKIAQAQMNKAGDTLGTIKARMYVQALATLRDTTNPLG
ncbi:hypothetical protein SGFS_098040 [Streptomyces graminofaciens]|uniref:Uncharacterized protein n=1 Tax=Streptomyces graminofaciens TaxID=68212 RepID=A0ABM8HMR4_9ACTN|nr:hypothetical protein SGFS_098040 [Streptomyces graminofaciens]